MHAAHWIPVAPNIPHLPPAIHPPHPTPLPLRWGGGRGGGRGGGGEAGGRWEEGGGGVVNTTHTKPKPKRYARTVRVALVSAVSCSLARAVHTPLHKCRVHVHVAPHHPIHRTNHPSPPTTRNPLPIPPPTHPYHPLHHPRTTSYLGAGSTGTCPPCCTSTRCACWVRAEGPCAGSACGVVCGVRRVHGSVMVRSAGTHMPSIDPHSLCPSCTPHPHPQTANPHLAPPHTLPPHPLRPHPPPSLHTHTPARSRRSSPAPCSAARA